MDGPPYRRSERPFFADSRVVRLIGDIAETSELTIYVGAGATIDKGGPSWGSLIKKIVSRDELKNRGIISDLDIDVLSSKLSPLEAATVVLRYFSQSAGGGEEARARAQATLVLSIGLNLYPDAMWDSGELTRAIAEVAIVRAHDGRRTKIITTNYDTFLEQEVLRQIALVKEGRHSTLHSVRTPTTVSLTLTEAANKSRASSDIEVIYLHGRIDPDPEQGVRGKVGITELDYLDLRPEVSEFLRTQLAATSLLILGASLTDPPLLTALQATRPEGETDHKRAALLPTPSIQSMAGGEVNEQETLSLRRHHEARMKEFGVSVFCPDFFGQVAQFCDEIVSSMAFSARGESYLDDPTIQYGGRLASWWTRWHQDRFKDNVYRRSVYRYLRIIASQLMQDSSDRRGGGDANREVLKIEAWARWTPSSSCRMMKLWSSSSAFWQDEYPMRHAEISAVSKYSSIQSILSGRPIHRSVQREDVASPRESTENPRWKVFLSVPILIKDSGGRIPVGAITLASMSNPDRSITDKRDPETLESLVEIMQLIGKRVFEPKSRVKRIAS